MTTRTTEELAQAWLAALEDVDSFYPLCSQDARVWHSVDNVWMTVEEAISNVHTSGGLPPLSEQRYRLTSDGFLVQFTLTLGDIVMHNTILVRVRDGLAHEVEEYVGLEQDIRSMLMEKLGIAAG